MSSKKIALLIIDMQNDFVLEDASFRVKGALDAVGNMEKVLRYFRKNNLPIFHVVRIHREDGCDVEITRKEAFLKSSYAIEGSKGAEIVDAHSQKGRPVLAHHALTVHGKARFDIVIWRIHALLA